MTTAGTVKEPLQLQLVRIAVRELEFRTLEREGRGEAKDPAPARISISLQVSASIFLSEDGKKSEVRFDVELTPDPQWQPYKIRVVLSGLFSTAEEGRKDDLGEFSQKGAPNILWPFVRDYVHRLTGDGLYGPVLIDPLYVGQLIPSAAGQGATVGTPMPADR